MLSHRNVLHNVESCRVVLQTVELDRFAVLLPMFHSYMLTVGVFLPMLIGGSMVVVRSLHPVRNALQEIFARQATILPGIPQIYRSMTNSDVPVPLPLRVCIQRIGAVAGANPEGLREEIRHPADRRLRLERGQPGRRQKSLEPRA